MDHGGVVATANQLSDTTCGHLRVFLSQIHRDLAHLHEIALAALAEHILLTYTIMVANFLEDIIDGQRVVVYLDSTLDDSLCQAHIHIRVVNDRIGHQGVDYALKIAHAAIGRLCDILDQARQSVRRRIVSANDPSCPADPQAGDRWQG